jgi:hypothetical protein
MVNPDMAKMCCCALNITNKPLKFRAGTPLGVLARVKICKAFKPEPPPIQENLPPIQQMKAALEQKGINLTDTVSKGTDQDQLVTLLYKNIDLYATSLKVPVGTDSIEYDIDINPRQPPV